MGLSLCHAFLACKIDREITYFTQSYSKVELSKYYWINYSNLVITNI